MYNCTFISFLYFFHLTFHRVSHSSCYVLIYILFYLRASKRHRETERGERDFVNNGLRQDRLSSLKFKRNHRSGGLKRDRQRLPCITATFRFIKFKMTFSALHSVLKNPGGALQGQSPTHIFKRVFLFFFFCPVMPVS